MPYATCLKQEAAYLAGLGSTATKDKFHALYFGVLITWFPTSMGYLLDPQILGRAGRPEYFIVRHGRAHHSPLLIVELRRPSKWNDAGRQEVMEVLTKYIEGRLDLSLYNIIYGVAAIGLHWMACKMEKGGSHVPTVVLDWKDDVSSDQSYNDFRALADLVYNIQ